MWQNSWGATRPANFQQLTYHLRNQFVCNGFVMSGVELARGRAPYSLLTSFYPAVPMSFVPITRLTPCNVEWLWPGRLALGHLALFDGDPGLGKSLITMDLCARITTGRPFPDGASARAPAAVVIANAEDGTRDTIHGRLRAAGADLGRVIVWERNPGEAWLRLPEHVSQLDSVLASTAAAYVVLDPIFAFLDREVQAGSDPSVRQALAPLADLARRHRCVIQLVRHLSKGGAGPALYRGLYSIAFIAACRLAWMAAIDPRQPRRFILGQLKNNLDPPQPSLAYTIAAHASGAGRIDWHGTSPWRDDDLVVRPGKRLLHKQRVHDFLFGFLANGPRTSRAIWDAAVPLGLSRDMLRRARKQLEIRTIRSDPCEPEQQSWWLLPGQDVPEHLRNTPDGEWDRFMRERKSNGAGPSPLDEP
jgi:hypothetical protein